MMEIFQSVICCEEEHAIFLQKTDPYPNYLHEVDLSRLPLQNKET